MQDGLFLCSAFSYGMKTSIGDGISSGSLAVTSADTLITTLFICI